MLPARVEGPAYSWSDRRDLHAKRGKGEAPTATTIRHHQPPPRRRRRRRPGRRPRRPLSSIITAKRCDAAFKQGKLEETATAIQRVLPAVENSTWRGKEESRKRSRKKGDKPSKQGGRAVVGREERTKENKTRRFE